jgi:hypothetical protein
MTVWELLDTLRQVPRQARHNYLQLDRADPQAALQLAWSDQEKWDFRPEGRTIQELLDTLKQVPRQARHNYVMMVVSPSGSTELAALQFAPERPGREVGLQGLPGGLSRGANGMVNLEGMTMKELREIARSYGISYISERRKANLVRLIHQADKWRHYVVPGVVGYFLDGAPILEDAKKQGS